MGIKVLPRIFKFFWLILLGMTLGCGESGPVTFPVEGKVLDKNGKPLSGGIIQFTPQVDSKFPATGKINDDGYFRIETHFVNGVKAQIKLGAVEGEHQVIIDLPNIKNDTKGQIAIRPIVMKSTYHVKPTTNEFTIKVN